MYATSKAIEAYDASKGDFWSYASVVIKNRLNDTWHGIFDVLYKQEIIWVNCLAESAYDGLQCDTDI